MPSKESEKYLLPISVTKHRFSNWLSWTGYEYKLYSDSSEDKFTVIKFIDFGDFIIGHHEPTKLMDTYDKVMLRVKTSTVKTALEIKKTVDEITDLTKMAAVGTTQEVGKIAREAAQSAGAWASRLSAFAKDKMKKSSDSSET